MARSAALAKLNRSELGWAAGSNAMKDAQQRLATYLESVKHAGLTLTHSWVEQHADAPDDDDEEYEFS